MLYLKSCPKCHGDMYLEKDNYGAFRQCLQCGLIRDMDVPAALTAQAALAVPDEAHRRGRKRKTAVAA
jgi:hypothetical protein